MRKINYPFTALLLFCAAMFTGVSAQAQRRNTTSHDVKVVNMAEENVSSSKASDSYRKSSKKHKHECKDKKDCQKKHKKLIDEQIAEYQEDYQKALNKISKSSFSDKQKAILVKQATENRDLAIKQLNERQELRNRQMQERQEYEIPQMLKDKANRKAVKKVNKIG